MHSLINLMINCILCSAFCIVSRLLYCTPFLDELISLLFLHVTCWPVCSDVSDKLIIMYFSSFFIIFGYYNICYMDRPFCTVSVLYIFMGCQYFSSICTSNTLFTHSYFNNWAKLIFPSLQKPTEAMPELNSLSMRLISAAYTYTTDSRFCKETA